MADRQPVDIGKPCRRDRQRRPWADDHPSLACIDAHHIKRFRLTADVDSATLAHREVDEPSMAANDRKSVVWGKSVSSRVDLGCPRIIKQKQTRQPQTLRRTIN